MQMAKCLESLLLHAFLPKLFFQRIWRVYKIVVEIPEGLGGGLGVILVVEKWKLRGGGGLT